MQVDISPPDYTKKNKGCHYLSEDGRCCHAKNYLRNHMVDTYCVVLLDEWIRQKFPDYEDTKVEALIKQITGIPGA